MALVGQKESKAQLRVPGLATESRSPVKVMAAGTVREFRHPASRRSRSQPTPDTTLVDDTSANTFPVEIVSKPKPVYTDEARKLNLEGEVLLEVMFGANGELHVNRVVRGLGHGLDEAAVTAANKIKFKPAQRNGSAVDSTAIVHVMFQLAS